MRCMQMCFIRSVGYGILVFQLVAAGALTVRAIAGPTYTTDCTRYAIHSNQQTHDAGIVTDGGEVLFARVGVQRSSQVSLISTVAIFSMPWPSVQMLNVR